MDYKGGFKMSKYSMFMAWSEEDQAYIVSVPELPGCMADGKTPEEAVKNAEIIIQEWIECALEDGEIIPEPSLYTTAQEAIKITIQQRVKAACDIAGISQTELGRKLGMSQQTFSSRLKVGKFRQDELEKMAEILGCKYISIFEFPDGQRVQVKEKKVDYRRKTKSDFRISSYDSARII